MVNETTPHSLNVMHIGDYLKAKREEAKLSLEKVSQKTKINLNILRSLEANDFQALPSPAYVKGFVMSYARVVGLNSDEVIHKLEYSYLTIIGKPFPALNHTRNLRPTQEATEVATKSEKKETSPEDILNHEEAVEKRKKVVVPSLVFAGVIIIFVGLYQIVTKTVEGEANRKEEKPYGATFAPSSELADINKPVVAKNEDTEASSTSEKVADAPKETVKENDTKETSESTTELSKSVRRNFPKKDFRKISTRLFVVMNEAPENQDEKILPSRIKSAFNRDMENIYVVATEGNTWLSYQVDGSPIESVILEKGKDLFLQGKEVLMFLGNVKVTKIFYQNRMIDAPTPTGFKSLIFPESQNSKHVLPLFPKAADDILYTAEEYQKRMKLEESELGKP
jgi:cytoskeleton protein RodZ